MRSVPVLLSAIFNSKAAALDQASSGFLSEMSRVDLNQNDADADGGDDAFKT